MYVRVLVILLILLAQSFAPLTALAQTAEPPSPVTNLDLASKHRKILPTNLVGDGSVVIDVGGTARTVTATDLLTPAEVVAVQQIINSGLQTIQLGIRGNAIGGSFVLPTQTVQSVTKMIIPAGVTVIGDITQAANLNIAGNFKNLGTFYAVSSLPGIDTATITARNILNLRGATLTTVLPPGGLTGFSGAVPGLNLSLIAVMNIVNQGVISSAGGLTAIAGGSIVNVPAAGGPTPIMQAVNNVNLQAMNIVNQGNVTTLVGNLAATAQTIVNSGLMQAVSGNVAIQSMLANLAVTNVLGTIAAKETISFSTIDPALLQLVGKPSISVIGGTLAAESVKVSSPSGAINVAVDRIQGRLDVTGGSAYVGAGEGTLELGVIELTGDPTFYNLGGDVLISSPLQFPGQDLAIVASRDILASPGSGIIDTSSLTGSGGSVTMMAGVDFVLTPDGLEPRLTVIGPSTSGGRIDLDTA